MAAKAARRSSNLWLHGKTWWCRIRMDGKEKRVSTGARVEAMAVRRRDLFEELVENRKHRDLTAGVIAGRITVEELYTAYHAETLDELRVQATSTNLEPLIEPWLDALEADEAVRADTRKEYRQKLRSLMPEDRPYYAAALTPDAVRAWLRGMVGKTGKALSTTTKRHYFDALRAFVRWAIQERSVWKVSPLLGMDAPKLGKARDRHFTHAQLVACLDAVTDEESRIALTLIAGTGMELGALRRVSGRGVIADHKAVWAHGTKNGYRDRVVYVREWAWKRVSSRLRASLGSAPTFSRGERKMRQDWYEAQRVALELGDDELHTIHDLRHSYCFIVLTGDDGEERKDLQWCADQLGHADTIMVSRIYGKYRLASRVLLESRAIEPEVADRIEDAPTLKVM